MRSTLTRLALAASVVVATAATAVSTPPQLVNYQGEVTDGGLPIADGAYPIEFRIFALEVGGVALWSEVVANVPVSNGRFNVLLGQVTPLPESVFDGSGRFLEAVFDGEVMIPRIQLVTVPYAHRISTVDGSIGGDISGEVTISGAATGALLRVDNSTGGAWGARFETSPLNSSEPTLLSVANGFAPAITAFHAWGGPAITSAGILSVQNENFSERLRLTPFGNLSGGQLDLLPAGGGTRTIELLATRASGQPGEINFYKDGIRTVYIAGGNATQGGEMALYNDDGTLNIFIDGEATGGGGRISILNGTDATVGGVSSGFLLLGSTSGPNLVFDNDEIMARNGVGTYAPLHLQPTGGQVLVGGSGLAVSSDYLFAVDGRAIMEEVEVQLSGDWPDYVFEPDYALMPLDELEEHVRTKKHLPGIPTAEEMKGARLPLGEMQTKLLEKVEELTLHVLHINNQLADAVAENNRLRDRIEAIGREVGKP